MALITADGLCEKLIGFSPAKAGLIFEIGKLTSLFLLQWQGSFNCCILLYIWGGL